MARRSDCIEIVIWAKENGRAITGRTRQAAWAARRSFRTLASREIFVLTLSPPHASLFSELSKTPNRTLKLFL